MKFYFLVLFLIKFVHGKDSLTISFLKSYIENEQKPTDLICYYLDWNKYEIVKMVRALSSSSVRSTCLFESKKLVSDLQALFVVDLENFDHSVLTNLTHDFRPPFRWLVLSDAEEEDKRKFLWDLPLLLDVDFVLAIRNKDVITLTELYKPSPKGPTYTQARGFYNGSLVDIRPRREMYRRRGDVMGHEMVMSNVIQESNTTKYHLPREDRLKLHYDAVAKMAWIVGRLTFEMVNATPKYIFSYRYGYKNNGVWSGMIDDLITGKAVMGSNCLVNAHRLEVVTYTDVSAPFQVRFIFRQPPLADISNIFLLPFSINVWVATIISALISVLAIYLASVWEVSRMRVTNLDGKITDAMLVAMSAVSQQGSSFEPRKFSGRLMFWSIFLSMMTIYTAYSANIVVLLQAPSNAIRTFEQLAKSKITLAGQDMDYNNFIMKIDNDPIKKDIYKRVVPDHGKKHLYNLDECVRKLRKESYAIHGIEEPVYRRIEQTFLETEKCDLTVIDFVNAFDPFVPVYKLSPYLELIRVGTKRIHEAGIRTALEERYKVPKPKCTNKGSAFTSIGIQNMKPVVLLILLGVAVSLLILLLEIITHKIATILQQKQILAKIRHQHSLFGNYCEKE